MKRRGLEPKENERQFSVDSAQHSTLQRLLSAVRVRVARTNLAAPGTTFVGRVGELEALRTLVRNERLVTIVGPAGAGKTRLAIECALQLADPYVRAGGAWLVDLAEARTKDDVCRAIARTLGVSLVPGGADPAGQLGAVLTSRARVLLVLDHADGAASALAALLPEWTRGAPEARWMATARGPLGVEGEARFELGPMCLPVPGVPAERTDAVQLLLTRAHTQRLERALAADEGPVLAQLAHDLRGNALAIELCAAQARGRPLQQLATLLSHNAGETAAIEVAWNLLDPLARQTLAQCSVFAGGFDSEAAAKVVELRSPYDATAVLSALDSLREKGLIYGSAPPEDRTAIRFALHPSVRSFAHERLVQSGERAAASLRHARYYLALGKQWAKRLDGPDFRDAARRLTVEYDNLLAVHRRALAAEEGGRRTAEQVSIALEAALVLDALLRSTGPTPLRLTLLDAALDAAAELSDSGRGLNAEQRARALEARGDARAALGKLSDARIDFLEAMRLGGSGATMAGAMTGLGLVELADGNVDEARSRLERALELYGQAGDRTLSARVLGHLARVYAFGGRTELARSAYEQAISLHGQLSDQRFEALDVYGMGALAHDAGRLDEARRHYERALEVFYQLGDRGGEARTIGLLGVVAHEQGRHGDARELYERAVENFAEIGDRRALGRQLGWQASFLAEVGEPEQARMAFTRALPLLRACRDPALEALVLGALAALEASEGCLDTARAALNRASECARLTPNGRRYIPIIEVYRGHLELALAKAATSAGDDRRAAMYIETVRQRLSDATSPQPPSSPQLPGPRSPEMRLALRALKRAFEGRERGATTRPPNDANGGMPELSLPPEVFAVCAHGRWFRAPFGEQVPISRWKSLQNLVVKLAERRELAPGEALSVEDLVAAGWPGERILPKAGATRVYTALSTLRRLGLRDVLVRTEAGYLFRADVPIVRV